MKIYLVGGAVRDKLLNYPSDENDWVVVGATIEEMLKAGYTQVGKDFPVFLHPKTKEEFALARTERKTGPGYTGFSFATSTDVTLEEDLLRRDLTINAMALAEDGTLVDPYNGKKDLENKQLRHVSDSFCEDPVRILRVARFAARYHHLGFTVAPETFNLMRNMVNDGEVNHLVPERIWKEFSRALGERTPSVFIKALRACGALKVIVPELDELLSSQNKAAISPLAVLDQAAHLSNSQVIRFAALLMDIEQIEKQSTTARETIAQLCQRLAIPNEFRDLAQLAAEYHLNCHRAMSLTAQELLHFFKSLDVFRREARFYDFLVACQAHAICYDNSTEYPQAQFLKDALAQLKKIKPKNLMQEGFQGAELGRELDKRHLAQLDAFKNSK